MKRFYLLFCLLLSITNVLKAEDAVLTVDVKTAGTLSTLITSKQKWSTAKMKISGFLNGSDVKVIREMAGVNDKNQDTFGKLTDIDMTDVCFESGGDVYLSFFSTDTYEDINCKTEDDVFPEHFFYGTAIKSIVLPSTIKKIGDCAFQNCPYLTSITIPSYVSEIGSNAFSGSGLTSIDIPNSVKKMGSYCFWGCTNMETATFNAAVTNIPEGTFSQTNIETITLPEEVTEIGIGAFQYCYNLKTVTGGINVKNIKDYAFNQCKFLETFTIHNKVESIGLQSLANCGRLQSLSIPASVTYISKSAFINDTTLTAINVDKDNENYLSDNGVLYTKDGKTLLCCPGGMKEDVNVLSTTETIEEASFDHCMYIKNLSLPASLKEIGNDAFNFSISLNSIKCDAIEPPTIGWRGAFFYIPTTICKLTVPTGSKAKYQQANGWKDFTNIVENDVNAIKSVYAPSTGEEYYGINGVHMNTLKKGLIIVRDANGKPTKMFKK